MQRFAYKIVYCPESSVDIVSVLRERVELDLNQLGSQGWRLVMRQGDFLFLERAGGEPERM